MVWMLILFFTLIFSIMLVLKCKVKCFMAFKVGIFAGILTAYFIKIFKMSELTLSFELEIVFTFCFFSSISICTILWHFFRDPERKPPEQNNVILAPADGNVRYVKEIKNGIIPFSTKHQRNYRLGDVTKTELLKDGSYLIGVEMHILNVHVNRAPVSGKIIMQQPSKGRFLSLRNIQSVFQNERVTTVIDQGMFQIGVVQIASRLVRRIVSYHQEGDRIQKGQRIGMIKFGSQVDVVIPKLKGLEILVRKGEAVKAGETILGLYNYQTGGHVR